MHIPAISYIALSVLTVVKAQTLSIAAQPSQAANANNFFCGNWAGSPRAQDVPAEQLLPAADYIKRFFVEPQLTDPPYRPLMASEPRVQIPKLWGNSKFHLQRFGEGLRDDQHDSYVSDNFRLALLSYSQDKPAKRLYSSSKSRWVDFHQALEGLMTECVSKGSGGAYLVPRAYHAGSTTRL